MFDIVAELIAAKFNTDKRIITKHTKLADDLHLDSLDMVELALAMQDELGIAEIPDELLAEIETVGELVRIAEKLVR